MDDFRIQLGAELEKNIGTNVQNELKKIENLHIQISDIKFSELANTSIQKQLDTISKSIKPISIPINTKGLSAKSNLEEQIFNAKELDKQGRVYFSKIYNTIDRMLPSIKSKFSSLGFDTNTLKVSGLETTKGTIQSFSVAVTDANKQLKTFNFERNKLQVSENGRTRNGFIQTNNVKVLDNLNIQQHKLATSQIEEQAKSLKKILELKTQIASKNSNTNTNEFSTLQRQLQAEQSRYNLLSQESAKYNDIISKEERRRILTEQAADSIRKLQQTTANLGDKSREQSIKEETKAIERQIKAEKQVQSEIEKTKRLNLRKANVSGNIDTFLKQNTKLSKELREEFQKLKMTIDSVDAKGLANVKTELSTLKNLAKENGEIGRNWANEIGNNAKKVFNWVGATGLVFAGINGIKKATSELKEINTILTEISKTSDRTSESLKRLGSSSFEKASEYGQKASDYLIGVQEMSRAGFDEVGSEKMAELSTLAQSAGDMTAELANKYLIATDAAYDLKGSTTELNAILDGQNQITNRNAVNMEELANATKVAANQLSNSNIQVNETSALLATGIATTQESDETVGRAVKGIIMNLQQVKGETGFDGEIIDEESLKKVEARLHGVGVELEYMKDGVATLRNPIEVLKELANVYNSLPKDSAEKAGIISDVGGKICHVA